MWVSGEKFFETISKPAPKCKQGGLTRKHRHQPRWLQHGMERQVRCSLSGGAGANAVERDCAVRRVKSTTERALSRGTRTCSTRCSHTVLPHGAPTRCSQAEVIYSIIWYKEHITVYPLSQFSTKLALFNIKAFFLVCTQEMHMAFSSDHLDSGYSSDHGMNKFPHFFKLTLK